MCNLISDLSIVMSNIEFLLLDKLEYRHEACSGHTACPGHRGGLGTEHDVQVTDGYLGHGIFVHMISNGEISIILVQTINTMLPTTIFAN